MFLVYPVASSRFPGAAERAQQGRDVNNSGSGLSLALPGRVS